MAITQIITTLPAVLNDSATFYEDIAERNNSLVTTVLPSINTWAIQANTTQTEINAKAAQVAAQAVDGGYSQDYINSNFFSQDYINSNFIGVNNTQDITEVKTFTVSPIVPTPTTDYQVANKKYVNDNLSKQTFDKPSSGPLFVKVSPSSIKIATGLRLTVNSVVFTLASDYTLTLESNLVGSSKIAGTDYYVYAKEDGSFYISASNSITTDRLIGGFHYGLTEEAEAISGNKTEADMVKIRGINAYSFWDLKYFAKCGNNKGMFCNGIAWYDIYLADTEYGINGYSRPFSQIAGGGTDFGRGYPKIPLQFGGNGTVNYGKLTPFVAYDLAISAKKDLIGYKEFTDIAYGVQEGLSQAEPVLGQNGHIPALTSKYGMELATGNQWIWSSEIGSSTASGWSSIADARGQVYTNAYVARLGGDRGYSAGISGSRCSSWYDTLSFSVWSIGLRSRSDLVILD